MRSAGHYRRQVMITLLRHLLAIAVLPFTVAVVVPNATTNQLLGSITEADLKVLVDGLEEESMQDRTTTST
jgi:hypothetical protein